MTAPDLRQADMAPNFDHQKKVFICGTGRSGTSLLHDMVSAHPQIHGLRGETKFIVEGDGLAALIDQLPDALWPVDPVRRARLRRAQAAIQMRFPGRSRS